MRYIFIIMALGLCLTGCGRYDIEEILLQRDDLSLTIKGEDVISYRPETFQIGHNAQRNEFRVFDDELGNWFVLTCEERPSSTGQVVKADLKWTGTSTTKSRKGLSFSVEKTDSKGNVWLWCEEHAIGVVVREL